MGIPLADAVGLTEREISLIAEDQGVPRLPLVYGEFLREMGRGGGKFLAGTEAFYPGILGLKEDAARLLLENRMEGLISKESIVFAMHQGFQVYWMIDFRLGDPAVRMFQEGESGIFREWDSFSDFLRDEASRI